MVRDFVLYTHNRVFTLGSPPQCFPPQGMKQLVGLVEAQVLTGSHVRFLKGTDGSPIPRRGGYVGICDSSRLVKHVLELHRQMC